jgi:hypothetical protein
VPVERPRGCPPPQARVGSPLPCVGSERCRVAPMAGLGHLLLTLRATGLTLCQDAIVVVNGGQPESELSPLPAKFVAASECSARAFRSRSGRSLTGRPQLARPVPSGRGRPADEPTGGMHLRLSAPRSQPSCWRIGYRTWTDAVGTPSRQALGHGGRDITACPGEPRDANAYIYVPPSSQQKSKLWR